MNNVTVDAQEMSRRGRIAIYWYIVVGSRTHTHDSSDLEALEKESLKDKAT